MASLGTNRLNIVNDQPAVEKLWNDRYRLEFYCDNDGKKTDWYYTNVGNILPDFGTLQGDGFGENPSESISASKYADMRLIEVGTEYVPAANQHYVKLTYETLTAAWVLEKDEDTDYELNGLKRVTRQSVALPDTAYTNVVGTSTITSDGTTLYLGSYKIEETDAKWMLTEVWLEAGTLSETTDFVGSQQSRVIETIGADPSTPSGYSLASKQESNFEGFQTNRFTFLKNDVELSRSEDKVGSQLAIVIEQFNGTPATPAGYSIANTQVSDVEGVPTRRYTFLKPSILSQSEDKVGSQLAIAIEAFDEVPATPSGYSLANTQVSDVEGIVTNRYTFLKPSILSLQQDFNNGLQRVSVQAFGMTATSVSAELAAITSSHALISQTESDYEGIKTSTFQYQLDEAFTEDYELNGLKRISLTELSAFDFSAETVGGVSTTAPTTGLYLGTQDIDNGGDIKVRRSVWLEAGELSRDVRSVGQGVQQTTHQFLVTEGTTVGDIISRDIDDFEGLKRITVSVIAKSDGTTLTNANGAEKLNYSYQDLVLFTFPGVVDLQNNLGHIFPAVRSPVEAKIKADVYTYYQTSSDIVAGDFTKQSSLGLWNPSEWCQKISTITSSLDNPAYFNAQGLRGCRTRDAFKLTGNLYGSISNNLKYSSLGSVIQINSLELEETTNVLNGKAVYEEVFRYTNDATQRLDLNVGGLGVNIIQTKSSIAKGQYTIQLSWDGSQWVLTGTNIIIDPQPTETGTGDNEYVYSQAAGGYLDQYTNKSSTNTYTLFTSTNGANQPEDADWPSGVTAEESDNSEEFGISSAASQILGTTSVAANFGFIEGRVVEGGAYGNIRISGGPPNPFGRKYTLDVDVERAFTKLDGTDVYKKTIVIATCTPA